MKKRFLTMSIVLLASFNYMLLPAEYINGVKTSLEMNDAIPDQYANLSAPQSWNTFKSAYFTVYYLPQDDLKSIERKLRTRTLPSFGRNTYPDNVRSSAEKIAYRLDMLFIRTRELLDTYPDVHVNLRIFKTRQELGDEYYKIYKRGKDMASFYVNKDKTIYVCESDLTDSLIVQEMARVIVDQDIGVILPAGIKNLFSSYVNSHLDE
ncbi:MAG: hypothetical protein NT036_02600 [Candidatus Omnitrophica bacterium]|nr:hypothetical protein [Candidatus Omnitrophota bacterium]